jgi:hypothetical protein
MHQKAVQSPFEKRGEAGAEDKTQGSPKQKERHLVCYR